MKGEEEIERGLTIEEVTSLNRLDDGLVKSDSGDVLSPVSSRYSSCEESEFDRYCSANSVMGTPSVCSSMGFGYFHDNVDIDGGSLNGLEGFSLGGERVRRKYDGNSHSLLGRRDSGGGSSSNIDSCRELEGGGERLGLSDVGGFEGKMEVLDDVGRSSSSSGVMRVLGSKGDEEVKGVKGLDGEVLDDVGRSSLSSGVMRVLGSKGDEEIKGVKGLDGEVGKKEDLVVLLKNVENVLLQGVVAARSAADNLLDCNHADEMDDERCRELDETSSRCDHSEGEDSMFDYGSDDGSQPRAYYVKHGGDHRHEDVGSGSLVLMNPSVAFGSNDWEDFELDGMENMAQLPDSFWSRQPSSGENRINSPDLPLARSTSNGNNLWREEERNERVVITTDSDGLLGVDKSSESSLSCSTSNVHTSKSVEARATIGTGDISGRLRQIASNDELDEYLENCSVDNIFQKQCTPVHVVAEYGSMTDEPERKNSGIASDSASGHNNHLVSQGYVAPLPDTGASKEGSNPSTDVRGDPKLDVLQGDQGDSCEGPVSDSASTWVESEEGKIYDKSKLTGQITSSSVNVNGKDVVMDALYDEFVHEMEEILLESCDSSIVRSKQSNNGFQPEQSAPLRDGDTVARTSGFDDENPWTHHPLRIDGIEVVGTKQIKGDISLSERLVGVKEYTAYIIRVWSGKDQWEVERRYRDFCALYHELKAYFAARECTLPPVWSSVDKVSRNFFGSTSPNVVAERSILIQECLCSILQSRYCSSLPKALIWFLSVPEALLSSSQTDDVVRQSNVGTYTESVPSLGKTISLIVDIRSHKSLKELLDAQHYTCAGCHRHFDNGKTRMLEIAQTFGWGKPRLCEYTGQLFCSSCHTNETAVLPARVLHNWDFTPYPVSQMAKSFLDSIIDKPMLCVSAANPFLFSRVPPLIHVVGIRRKIGAMLPYIRCSFRRSIYRRLGYRKYLLEANDFFALRDLIDLSKGAFAALPAILEAVSKKIQEHITELCLECCDNGLPCGARQACDNLSSLIFPFQEEEIRRCKSCKSVYHERCFKKVLECPCGAVLKGVVIDQSTTSSVAGPLTSSQLVEKSDSSSGFLSGLFSTSKQDKGRKENDNVILMGSLPNTSL